MKIAAIMAGSMAGDVESGVIGEVIRSNAGQLDWFYRNNTTLFPKAQDYDAMIVFGGEISVCDLALEPYFTALGKVIRCFHGMRKPVLGSCLGAQAIAFAFAAAVKPQGFLEYGFTSLEITEQGLVDPLLKNLDSTQILFEMHSDTFDFPKDSVPLLKGERVTNQGFRLGDTTYGFQCHYEVTPQIVSTWTKRELINNTDYSQDYVNNLYQTVMHDFKEYQDNQRRFAIAVINRWLDLI